ncbi:DUF3502 domain-containing protein [Paenibacillus cymbidii]|uniref:DUF3502 domain-containing protein n=1 Tax=Paenibacillus cymbidii TaxID=1639034 RepID=UPI002E25FC1C
MLGFSPDMTPVKTIAANVNAVNAEYQPGLITGTVDPAKYLPEYFNKLKQADPEAKVVTELQKQLDEWLKTNK